MLNKRRLLLVKWMIRLYVAVFLMLLPGISLANSPDNSARAPFTISLSAADFNGFNVSCNGASDGSIDLTINGGTSPFTITWSNGASSEDISGLVAGTYTVTVTDNDGDSQTDNITLTEAAAVIAPGLVTNVGCFNAATGSIDLSPSGGTNAFTFLWSDGKTTEDLSNLTAGTYTVTVTDQNNCIASNSFNVTQPAGALVVNGVADSVSCNAGSDGSIDITVTGGTPNYSFLWNDGNLSEDRTNLSAGTYTVTVTDANTCTASQTFTVFQPTAINLIASADSSRCFGSNDGQINLSPSGGTSPFTFLWNDGITTEDRTNLSAGTYTVTITDNNLCVRNETLVIGQPTDLSVVINKNDAICIISTGSATAVPSGGTGNYSYQWSNGASSASIINLSAGTYTVTVTDINGCTETQSTVINNILGPNISSSVIDSVNCFGGSDGTINITITPGGSIINAVLWNDGITTEDRSALSTGTYTVTVTDLLGCTASQSYIVSQPLQLTVNATSTNTTCAASNGTASALASGGTGGYSWLWSNSSSAQNIINLAAGTFTVTVTDINGCTATDNTPVGASTNPLISASTVDSVNCFGGSDGAIAITVINGTPAYTFLWNDGITTEDRTALVTGTYTVTVTDQATCTTTQSFVVSQPVVLTGSTSTTPAGCANANGTASVTAAGGTGGLTYLWNNGITTAANNNIIAGTYTVTVTDINGCTIQRNAVVGNTGAPSITTDSTVNTTCFGGNDGGIYITVIGGTPNYSYQWSNGFTTQDVTNLTAGTYTVTVTDAANCIVSQSFIISQPTAVTVSINTTNTTCGNSNGALTAVPGGGTPNYTFLWSNAQSSSTISALASGTYTVTVTDARGCTVTDDAIVAASTNPLISTSTVDSVNCFGGSDGAISITVINGNPPNTFLWNDGITTEDRTGLLAGTYTVTVSDLSLCTTSQSFVVSQPVALTAGTTTTPAGCGSANGSVSVLATGGTGGLSYLWNNGITSANNTNVIAGTYTVTVTDINGCTIQQTDVVGNSGAPTITTDSTVNPLCFSGSNGGIYITINGGTPNYTYQWSNGFTTEDITNLIAGTYTVTVTDAATCVATQSFILGEPAAVTITFNSTNPSCGGSNGSITALPGGGTPTYTYLWSNAQLSQTISSLTAGTYTVTVTDINGCTVQNDTTLVSAAGPSVVVDSVVDVSCFGNSSGAIYITPSSGSLPYSYLWSNGALTQDLVNVAAGTYTVTVTDGNSCTATISDVINSPAAISFNLTSTPALCGQLNGTATINNLTGGTGSYTILWSNGDTGLTADSLSGGLVSVTVTDANNCVQNDNTTISSAGGPSVFILNQVSPSCYGGNDGSLEVDITGNNPPFDVLWSNGDTDAIADSLTAGNYTVTVTDGNGCSVVNNYQLTQPDSFTVTFTVSDASCGSTNGSVTAAVSGATPGYSLAWSNGDTGLTADSLSGNIYTVTITDANFCTVVKSVTVNTAPPPSVTIDNVIDVSCFGAADGAINISVSDGTSPFTYVWSNNTFSEDLINVSGGVYTVTVTDSAGCTDTLSALVNEASAIIINSVVTNAACGDSTGSIQLNVSGGIPNYSYQWSNAATTGFINNLYSGTYTVTVTDAASCTQQAVIPVGNVNGPVITLLSHQMVSCNGSNNGAINVDITGGAGSYNFLWSNAATTQNISSLAPGIYILTVTDVNGCEGLFSDTITEPSPISLTAVIENPSCFLSNGAIVVAASGGTPLYSYLWSNGIASSGINGLAGSQPYTVTVTDGNFCTFDSTFQLTNTGTPVITLQSLNDVSCFGASDGSIDINVSGGIPPYSYFWQVILQTTEDVTGLSPNVYDVIVADSTGCSSTAQYTITEPSEIVLSFPLIINSNCGQANGTLIANATGGSSPYSYQWSNGAVNDTVFNLTAGSYTATVTDNAGCSVSEIANISDLGGPTIDAVDSTLITCPGGSDGSITITASGGVAPLTYSWTNVSSNQATVNNLSANIYTVTVSDAANCQVIRSVNITDPPDFVINAALSQNNPPYNLTCFQTNDGSIDVTVTGGTAPYIYIWSTGSNNEDISNLTAGTYTLIVRDSRLCEGNDTILLTQPPQITAAAGLDITICGIDSLVLSADSIAGNLLGHWTAVAGSSAVFTDPSTYNTLVDSLPVGVNILTWTVSQLNGNCAVSDDVVITVNTKITSFAGVDKTDLCGEVYALDATQPQFGSGYWMVLEGNGILDDTSSAVAVVSNLSPGANYFVWTVNNGNCEGRDTVLVFQQDSITCLSNIQLPSAFSPNGDGFNDFFVVKGIEDYTSNSLSIVNRWGAEVYQKSNYSNEWNGVNESSDPLPDGTYFYILKVDGVNEVFKGFVDIRR